jgi:hypothetical protein
LLFRRLDRRSGGLLSEESEEEHPMPARTPERWTEIALSYGPLAAVVWGVIVTLGAFYSPQNVEWSDWLTLLVGGVAAILLVPLGLAFGARRLAGRRRRV